MKSRSEGADRPMTERSNEERLDAAVAAYRRVCDWPPEMLPALRECLAGVLAAVGEAWQPIETAPRDGSDILLVVEATAHWQGRNPAVLVSQGWKLDLDTARALHWRPLPAPPQPTGGVG